MFPSIITTYGHAYGEEPLHFRVPEDETGMCVLICYWKVHIDSWRCSIEGH